MPTSIVSDAAEAALFSSSLNLCACSISRCASASSMSDAVLPRLALPATPSSITMGADDAAALAAVAVAVVADLLLSAAAVAAVVADLSLSVAA
eukprot:5613566-Amphidinium_carterae.1